MKWRSSRTRPFQQRGGDGGDRGEGGVSEMHRKTEHHQSGHCLLITTFHLRYHRSWRNDRCESTQKSMVVDSPYERASAKKALKNSK